MRINFGWWCHKVLPLVYDDSLSYYEVMCRVCEYISGMLEDVKELVSNYSELKTAVSNLRSEIDAHEERLDEVEEAVANVRSNVSDLNIRFGVLSNEVSDLVGEVEELSQKVPFAFGVDENGNYGYYKEGETEITPFKSGSVSGVIVGNITGGSLPCVAFDIKVCEEVT